MSTSTEQQLRDLFDADAAAAPEGLDLGAAARHRVRRRRRIQAAWISAAATAAIVTAVGAFVLDRPTGQPQAQTSSGTSVAHSPTSPPITANLPSGRVPGGPLADTNPAQCVKEYSPTTLAENAFAFDGTVTSIGRGRTDRPSTEDSGLRSVTFQVNEWFKGGAGATAVVDMNDPLLSGPGIDERLPAYQVGSRLLVTGMPRWGGAPLENAIAWGCGFTRYYSPEMAAQWATATK